MDRAESKHSSMVRRELHLASIHPLHKAWFLGETNRLQAMQSVYARTNEHCLHRMRTIGWPYPFRCRQSSGRQKAVQVPPSFAVHCLPAKFCSLACTSTSIYAADTAP